MNKELNLQMIADISNANGAPGFEDEVVEVLRRHAEGLGETKEDSLRNFYIYRKENKGNRPVVQLDAHSDEVAFMVQAIKPNGTLAIIPLGGWVTSNIPAHEMWVRNAKGEWIHGLTASKPPHFTSTGQIYLSHLSSQGAVAMARFCCQRYDRQCGATCLYRRYSGFHQRCHKGYYPTNRYVASR